MDQVSFCAIQDTSLPSEQLPSMVGRAEKSPVHFPCACGALARSPHLPTCLRWQWAISIVTVSHLHCVSLLSSQPSRIPGVLGVAVPLGLCPSPLGTGCAHGALQSHHPASGTPPVCFSHCHFSLCWLWQILSDSPQVIWLALGQKRDS